MATISFKKGDDYALKLSKLGDASDEIAKKAIYQGAKIVADRVKAAINALPEDRFRRLNDGEKFTGVPSGQKRDLADSFGVAPIARDEAGDYGTKLGFDGYGSYPTKKYPQGLPNQLLARAIEAGSSVRQATPFVKPAVAATKKQALDAMREVIDEESKKIMGG